MSRIAHAPLRTARQLQKAKEIKKVKVAIRWHEAARAERHKKLHERWEVKQVRLQRRKAQKEQEDSKKEAVEYAREDWRLGPLRPNRAVGHEATRYGAIEPEKAHGDSVPVKVQKYINDERQKKGEEPSYPIVVDDKKYFHITKDDRVVIIKGREKGKIGTVKDILHQSHDVIVKDLNKHYIDSRAYGARSAEGVEPKHEDEAPVPLEDVRLVIPYRLTTKDADGEPREIYEDVVVDHVIMERHTTGKDPFTGIDHGKDEFPEEHRFDPETMLPIFHRYVAGTRRRIAWPWELEEKIETDHATSTESVEKKGRTKRMVDWVKQRSAAAKGVVYKSPEEKKAEEEKARIAEEQRDERITEEIKKAQELEKIASQPADRGSDWVDDTGRNKVEGYESSFNRTLLYRPILDELAVELRPHIREDRKAREAKDKDAEGRNKKKSKGRQPVPVMTPQQLRWEVERKKQLEKPKVPTEKLLFALGKHMKSNGIRLDEQRERAAEKMDATLLERWRKAEEQTQQKIRAAELLEVD